MRLQFEHDAWTNLGLLTSPILADALAIPMAASIHMEEIQFDELLLAVLLQACLGGYANLFRVQKISSFCFRFFVPSVDSMRLILKQRSIKAKLFTLVFDHINHAPGSAMISLPPATTAPPEATTLKDITPSTSGGDPSDNFKRCRQLKVSLCSISALLLDLSFRKSIADKGWPDLLSKQRW
jgi:hypothetical protein